MNKRTYNSLCVAIFNKSSLQLARDMIQDDVCNMISKIERTGTGVEQRV